GMPRVPGRYDNGPTSPTERKPLGTAPTGGIPPRAWMQVDYNGMVDSPAASRGTTSGLYTLAAAPSSGSYYAFPTFPATTYGNGYATEYQAHASSQNFFSPQSYNRRLPLTGMLPFLRPAGTNSDVYTSDLARLLPLNLVFGGNLTRRRNAIT